MAKIFGCSPSWLMGFDADMDITVKADKDFNTLIDTKVKKTPCLSQFIPPLIEVGDLLLTAC